MSAVARALAIWSGSKSHASGCGLQIFLGGVFCGTIFDPKRRSFTMCWGTILGLLDAQRFQKICCCLLLHKRAEQRLSEIHGLRKNKLQRKLRAAGGYQVNRMERT